MALRMLGSSVAETTLAISIMKLLHAAELPLLLVSMFKYISGNFDARLSGTIFLVGFQFINQIAAMGPAIAAGMLYDTLGFVTSYQIMGALVAGFVVISRFALAPGGASGRQATPLV
jgi:OHS family lactose permease-like MFS transporter